VQQGPYEDRSIEKTLEIAWDLLSMLPETELKRVKREHLARYLPKNKDKDKEVK
jgi:V/A-type H+-transporting ATPase subunit B